MRPLIATAMVVLVAACGAPAIDDTLATDDVKLPDRSPVKTPVADSGTHAGDSGGNPTPQQHTITVTLAGAGAVTSVPAGVTCTGTTCKGTFPTGTAVSLTAAPSAGSVFSSWSGTCMGTTPCATNLTADVAVTAAFEALDGQWTGTYTNTRLANGCTFNNAGNLAITGKLNAAALTHSGDVTGLELRTLQGCSLVGKTTGTAPDSPIAVSGNTLTGTWNFAVQGGGGSLGFPFTAKVTGKTMAGTWTCATCTGSFTLTKP